MSGRRLPAVLAGLAIAMTAASAGADEASVAAFYKGRTVTLLLASSAGGGYDNDARIVSQHIVRHLPGQPTIVLQYMPGAGGMRAANYFHSVAAKDGSVFGLMSPTAAFVQLVSDGARYNAAEFRYVGRLASLNNVLVVWHGAPARTLEEMKTTEVVLGSVGTADQGYIGPVMLSALLGYKFKMITGYQSAKAAVLAMEIGEIHGRTSGWPAWKAGYAHWIAEKKITPLIEIGLHGSAEFAGRIPLALDLVKDPEKRRLLEFTSSSAAVGRVFSMPPGVPADRLAAFRRAFDATMKDPAFRADAERRKTQVEPMSGEEVQKIVERTVAASPAIVAETKRLLGAGR